MGEPRLGGADHPRATGSTSLMAQLIDIASRFLYVAGLSGLLTKFNARGRGGWGQRGVIATSRLLLLLSDR